MYKQLLEKYGEVHQMRIAQEELAELIQAISKYLRGINKYNLAEEIADVEIVLHQLKLLVTEKELNYWRRVKENKIRGLLK